MLVASNPNADLTNVATPFDPLLWLDLEVLRSCVVRDDPIVWETLIMDIMIEKDGRRNPSFKKVPRSHACDRVDSKLSCEFHFKSTTGPTGSLRSITWSDKVYSPNI